MATIVMQARPTAGEIIMVPMGIRWKRLIICSGIIGVAICIAAGFMFLVAMRGGEFSRNAWIGRELEPNDRGIIENELSIVFPDATPSFYMLFTKDRRSNVLINFDVTSDELNLFYDSDLMSEAAEAPYDPALVSVVTAGGGFDGELEWLTINEAKGDVNFYTHQEIDDQDRKSNSTVLVKRYSSGAAIILFSYSANLSAFSPAFLDFISDHRIDRDTFFPSQASRYGGKWQLRREGKKGPDKRAK